MIADDNDGIRVLLRTLLELEGDFVVVGEAADGAEALHLLAGEEVDLLVLDLSMPVRDGLEVLEELTGESSPRVAVFTGHAAPQVEARARALGARDVIRKGVPPGEIVRRLRAVAVGA